MKKEIELLCVGKIKEKYYQDICNNYSRDINKYADFRVVQVMDESIPESCSEIEAENVKKKEAEKLLAQIKTSDFVCCLCIEGKPLTQDKLKRLILDKFDCEKNIVFVIGGSLGLHSSITDRANIKISFSNMTFPHQLMRVILIEQIKRCVICDK